MSSFTTPPPPPVPVPPLTRARRRAAVVTVVVAAVLGCLGALASWNPWGYVGLGDGPYAFVAVATLFPVTAGVLALLLATQKAVAISLTVVCAVAAGIVFCGGGVVAVWIDPSWRRTVFATTGEFQVVNLVQNGLTVRQELRVAHPAGLLTRESTRPLACVEAVFNDHPKVTFTGARFVAPHEVEVALSNGTTWRTPFDPGTLRPARTLDADCSFQGAHVDRVP
ncbi:hypothetical protein AB0H83_09910 [Dactylosporangium sp. NPDC050688]|uniref:hypothetical protein n=1 Tax=Dactylosporangium sp. NPDC050688 TaxID=3157217 RepID=UPI003406D696